MWLNPQETADFVIFTEKILNGRRKRLCGVNSGRLITSSPWDNLNKYLAPSKYLSTDETLCRMGPQIAFCQYNSKKRHRYGRFIKLLNDARFSYIYKSVPYAAKPQAEHGLHYVKATINFVKHLVQDISSNNSWSKADKFLQNLYTQVLNQQTGF